MNLVLTKSTMPVIGWVADILGMLMDGIYFVIDKIGIGNVGLAIILFTIIMYALMTPLQIKQQKFSKLNAVMSPELQKIQKKYQGKKDQVSMTKMQEETQAVYQKYGVSPTGSCAQLLIQMPVLFALYQVIYHIPGYINMIGDKLTALVETSGATSAINTYVSSLNNAQLVITDDATNAQIVDLLYKLTPSQWNGFIETVSGNIASAAQSASDYIINATSFFGFNRLSISETPFGKLTEIFKGGDFGIGSIFVIIIVILIPVLAWFTQYLNYKLMPQPAQQNTNGTPGTMESTMKSMNTFMPIMSAVFCFTLPVGIGIYWVIGAVVRSVQQFVINKHMDKIDMNEMINANLEKANKKRAKQGLPPQKITNQAKMNVRNLEVDEEVKEKKAAEKAQKTAEKVKQSTEYYNANAKPGSLASKANMVKQFEERNKKK
ncbi:MAG: YidC/Oxa1 family membrane protein insertase [Lachnospiraceae bacterium]|nr:YidC/Oxa1 family membrane protein insertase [Lachnospiraceae bacterium]